MLDQLLSGTPKPHGGGRGVVANKCYDPFRGMQSGSVMAAQERKAPFMARGFGFCFLGQIRAAGAVRWAMWPGFVPVNFLSAAQAQLTSSTIACAGQTHCVGKSGRLCNRLWPVWCQPQPNLAECMGGLKHHQALHHLLVLIAHGHEVGAFRQLA